MELINKELDEFEKLNKQKPIRGLRGLRARESDLEHMETRIRSFERALAANSTRTNSTAATAETIDDKSYGSS